MPQTLRIGRYELDPLRHTLSGADRVVQLSPIASRFLQAMARRPGAVVERAVLIEELWRGDYLVGEPALNRVVSETRRAVGDNPKEPALIQTVPRRGYRLVAPAGDSEAAADRPLVRERWVKIWLLVLGSFLAVALVAIVIIGLAVASRHLR
jgi:DNA-binding winged helix-turn-helix (wHTH) protein